MDRATLLHRLDLALCWTPLPQHVCFCVVIADAAPARELKCCFSICCSDPKHMALKHLDRQVPYPGAMHQLPRDIGREPDIPFSTAE